MRILIENCFRHLSQNLNLLRDWSEKARGWDKFLFQKNKADQSTQSFSWSDLKENNQTQLGRDNQGKNSHPLASTFLLVYFRTWPLCFVNICYKHDGNKSKNDRCSTQWPVNQKLFQMQIGPWLSDSEETKMFSFSINKINTEAFSWCQNWVWLLRGGELSKALPWVRKINENPSQGYFYLKWERLCPAICWIAQHTGMH